MRERMVEITVGIFILAGLIALLILAFKVSGLTNYVSSYGYRVTASFDNIGSLKKRAPVTISGVKVGEVTDIALDSESYKAIVTMQISDTSEKIPVDSTANIYTAGLLGANYIGLIPGMTDDFLKNGSVIETTNSAIVLENLIGQFLFSIKSQKEK